MTASKKNLHIACSALHFEPVSDDIEWWVEFNITHPLKKHSCSYNTYSANSMLGKMDRLINIDISRSYTH